MEKIYKTEKEGQIDFFNNYGIPWQENNGVLVENSDGVYNGVLFEFKLNINDLNKTLFQAIKYLSRMRVHGESVPATILLVSLNNKTAYKYKSQHFGILKNLWFCLCTESVIILACCPGINFMDFVKIILAFIFVSGLVI